MALGAVQNNIEVRTNISASPNMIEAKSQGRFGSQTVSYASESRALTKNQFRSEAARTDIASLSLRVMKQGQGATLKATPRIVDYFDKLPNMPQMAALQNLVELLRSFDEALSSKAEGLTAPGAVDQDAAAQETTDEGVEPGVLGVGGRAAPVEGEKKNGGQQGGGERRDDARQELLNRIFAALQQTDADVTHQFATLDVLREYFRAAGASEELQEALAEAARAFDQPELMRDIRAGFAAAKIAQANAATLETSPALVRDAYRQMLREKRNYGQLFDLLARFDLLKKLAATIETFRTAAARDLAGLGSSPDQGFLEALLTELGKLKRLVTVLQLSEEVIAKMRRLVAPPERPMLEPRADVAIGIASRMLNFAASANVGLGDAKALLAPLEAATLASQVAFINELCRLHKWLPDEVLPSLQARLQQQKTLAALQSNLTGAEEESFANAAG